MLFSWAKERERERDETRVIIMCTILEPLEAINEKGKLFHCKLSLNRETFLAYLFLFQFLLSQLMD